MMKANKKSLAAAVAAALVQAAAAQSEVVVYGVAMPFLESVKTEGATQGAPTNRPTMRTAASYTGFNDPSRVRITVGTSQLGFRGSEVLSPGLKLVWQLESAFQIDQNVGPGLGARNSKIGLAGAFGEVNMGQWDTPYKFISLAINPFRAGYLFDYTGMMGNPGFGVPGTTTQFTRVGGAADAAFDRRVGNFIQYWTPRVGGFSGRIAWGTDEGRTIDGASIVGIKPQIWSAAIIYDVGPLSLRYGYEQHKDYFGLSQLGAVAGSSTPASLTNRSSKDRAHKLVALMRFGGTRFAAAAEELRYQNDDSLAGAMHEFKRRAFYGIVEQFFANNTQSVWAAYARAQDGSCSRVGGAACATSNLGAHFWAVGYIYRFSRRTEGFLAYYRLDNKESGTYSPFPFIAAPVAPGADTVGAGAGLIHYF